MFGGQVFWRPNVLGPGVGGHVCRPVSGSCLRFLCRASSLSGAPLQSVSAGRICRAYLQNMLAGVFALRRPGIAADITVDINAGITAGINAGINADKAADIYRCRVMHGHA